MSPCSLRPRKPFVGLVLFALAGIALAERWPQPAWIVICGAGAVGALLLIWRNAWLCRVFAGVVFFALHVLRQQGTAVDFARTLESGPQTAEAVGVVWSEPESFVGGRGEKHARFELKLRTLHVGAGDVSVGGLCLVRWRGLAPKYGDVVSIKGAARQLAGMRNPGEFDNATWLRRHGVNFEIATRNESDCEIVGKGEGSPIQVFAIAVREWVKERLEIGLADAPNETALIESMVLGMRGETPAEMKAMFQKTGTLHLFAVSGLNVAMLAAIAWYLLKPLRFSRAGAFFVIMPLLIAYAIATGLGASCVRATVMAGLFLAAPIAGRPAVPLNSIAAAALAILAWETNELFSPGFQLSFVLVLMIMLLAEPIARRVERIAKPDDFIPVELWTASQKTRMALWKILSQATGVTISAWLGSLFFMAGYFHLISPVAIVANAVAVPLAFFVLALGLMSLIVSFVSVPLLTVVNCANWACAKLLLLVVAFFARVPGGHVYVEYPRLGPALLCEITVLDVGQGAAIHLRAGRGDWMFDCGHLRDYERTVLPYLRSRGVNRLDGLILSHGDSSHIGGAVPLLSDFSPSWIADTPFTDRSSSRRDLHMEFAAHRFGRRIFKRGDEVTLSPKVKLRVLYPPSEIMRSSADDKALVCSIEADGLHVLLMSDAGFFTEQWLLANEPDLRADVLVMGWHDKDFSGTPDFLSKVQPHVVVCSEPPFGTPPEKFDAWAKPLEQKGVRVFSQLECGAVQIELRTDGEVSVVPVVQ